MNFIKSIFLRTSDDFNDDYDYNDDSYRETQRLTGDPEKKGTTEEHGNDSNEQEGSKSNVFDNDFHAIIGPGPESFIPLDEIKRSIEDLRPIYTKTINEKKQELVYIKINRSSIGGSDETKNIETVSLTSFIVMLTQYINETEREYNNNNSSNNSNNNSHTSSPISKDGTSVKFDTDNIGDIDFNDEDLKAILSKRAGTPSLRKVISQTNFKTATRNIRGISLENLRYLENQFNIHEQPQIIVRKHTVMLSVNPIKAIVVADTLYLIAPLDSDSILIETYHHIIDIMNNDDSTSLSFELKAYKAILSTVCSLHFMEYSNITTSVDKLMSLIHVSQGISVGIEYQEQIRIIKTAVSSLLVKVNGYKRLFTEVLTSAEDIPLMNLSLLKIKPYLFMKPLSVEILSEHEECSFLLESFLVEYNSLESKLLYLQSGISSADELMAFRLDASHNELLVVEMILAIVIVSISGGLYVTGLFGMNLVSGLEESNSVFLITSICLTILIMISAISLILWFRKTGTFLFDKELRLNDKI